MLEMPACIQAFYSPETYPHSVNNIRMIQTHASWVFLTGSLAYKFKKPVNFGFMDFSTLARRKYYCERELELNRRLSPELYLDVLPVYQQGDVVSLQPAGEIVDYCLQMLQFDQSCLLDQQLAQGSVDPVWMDALAAEVHRIHAQADIDTSSSPGHATLLTNHLRDNLAIAADCPDLPAATLKALRDFSAQATLQHQSTLQQRGIHQHIRRCHGDLHFRNIIIRDGQPALFDCIEFNDDYSIIDTMNDVAFLMMDCDAHARPDLGMRFLSRYLEYCGDYAGLQLLPLYLFYRASVRGKVACILAGELPADKQAPACHEARQYFTLAQHYTQTTPPALFAIGGLSGSGKSYLALKGCGIEQSIIIRSDATRKRIAHDYPGLALYSRQMHIHTYHAMFEAAHTALQAGYSVILDATFLHPDSRQQLHSLATQCHVPLHAYWLDIDMAQLTENIRNRQAADNDISDADLDVLTLQLDEYQRPTEAWIEFLPNSDTWPDRKDLIKKS